MLIQGNGNVGIGTTAPASKLSVVGQAIVSRDNAAQCCAGADAYTLAIAEATSTSGRQSSIQFHNSGESEAYIRMAGTGVGSRRFEIGDNQSVGTALQISSLVGTGNRAVYADDNGKLVASSTAGVISGSGTADYLARWTPDGATLGIGATQDDGTNVGIGVTPAYKLDIGHPGSVSQVRVQGGWDDALTSNSRVIFNDHNFGIGAGQFGGGSAEDALNLWSYNGAGRGILFSSTSAGSTTTFQDMQHNMFIDGQTGNVGINTTDPDDLLHIYTTTAQGTSATGGIPANSEVATLVLEQRHSATKTLEGVANAAYTASMIDFRANNATDRWSVGQVIGLVDAGGGSYAGGMAFTTSPGGTTNPADSRTQGANLPVRMLIQHDGDVGIGTVEPSTKLDVEGSIRGKALVNSPHSLTNSDAGNQHWVNRNDRLLTSNGAGWTADGRDPVLTIVTSGNSNSTAIGNSIGLALHNESQTDNTYSPLITFSNRSNSGNYNTTYAAIGGRKTGQATDSNWSAGELNFWTNATGSGAYMTDVPEMVIKASGNVGIGTTGPAEKLEVNGNIALSYGAARTIYSPDATGGNITGYDLTLKASGAQAQTTASSGGNLNLTAGNSNVAGSQGGGNIVLTTGRNYWNNGANPNARHGDIVFRGGELNTGFSATIKEHARIDGTTGNVGIGTASPAAKVHVAGAYSFVGGDDAMLKIKSVAITGAGNCCGTEAISLQTSIDSRTDDYDIPTYGNHVRHVLALQPQGGYVGIGTTGPSFPLHVNGHTNTGMFGARYYNSSGNIGWHTSWNVTGYFSEHLACSELEVFSDARIKKIRGVSNSANDLNILMGIEVTDYSFIDSIRATSIEKKVVAQQVEEVYPIAVSEGIGFIPNVYTLGSATFNEQSHELTIGLDRPHEMVKNDRVRLILKSGEKEYVVTAVSDEHTFSVKLNEPNFNQNEVFVYGKEVEDFRTVDYDAIGMLNVSATQELARQLETAKCEIETLKNDNQLLKSQVNSSSENYNTLKAEVETLKQIISVYGMK